MKNLPSWAFHVLSIVGVALVASMALTWIDFGGNDRLPGESKSFFETGNQLIKVTGGKHVRRAATEMQSFDTPTFGNGGGDQRDFTFQR